MTNLTAMPTTGFPFIFYGNIALFIKVSAYQMYMFQSTYSGEYDF